MANYELKARYLSERLDGAEVRPAGGDSFFEADDGSEWLVLNGDERLEWAKNWIEESISYFNADFLEEMTGVPAIAFEKLIDENDAVHAIVKGSCGIDKFVEAAVRADGYGHFISGYDGEEVELGDDVYAYRVN